jgi:hypothetical protein
LRQADIDAWNATRAWYATHNLAQHQAAPMKRGTALPPVTGTLSVRLM